MPTNETNPDVLYMFYGTKGRLTGFFSRKQGSTSWSSGRVWLSRWTMILADSSCDELLHYKCGDDEGLLPGSDGPVLPPLPNLTMTVSLQDDRKQEVTIGIVSAPPHVGDFGADLPDFPRPPVPTLDHDRTTRPPHEPLDHGPLGPRPLKR